MIWSTHDGETLGDETPASTPSESRKAHDWKNDGPSGTGAGVAKEAMPSGFCKDVMAEDV